MIGTSGDGVIGRPNQMLLHRGMVREMQANISHDIADRMHEMEDQDWFLVR